LRESNGQNLIQFATENHIVQGSPRWPETTGFYKMVRQTMLLGVIALVFGLWMVLMVAGTLLFLPLIIWRAIK
jgi:hypothetical protein